MKNLSDLKNSERFKKEFKVPENYFEDFSEKMMDQLPDIEPVFENEPISLWKRVRPIMYMAAMFLSIIFTIRVFVGEGKKVEQDTLRSYVYLGPDEIIDFDYPDEVSYDDYTIANMDDYTLIESYATLTSDNQ
ncbi:MAG: hypothetical protein ACRCXN_01805 [Bacteroidales bacterium]